MPNGSGPLVLASRSRSPSETRKLFTRLGRCLSKRANLLLKNPAKPKCRFATISVIGLALPDLLSNGR
jgi:hypothetical protein